MSSVLRRAVQCAVRFVWFHFTTQGLFYNRMSIFSRYSKAQGTIRDLRDSLATEKRKRILLVANPQPPTVHTYIYIYIYIISSP